MQRRNVHRKFHTGRRISYWVAGVLLASLSVALLGSALPVSSQTQTRPQPQGQANPKELLRLIEAAREAGLSEEEIRMITLEDEAGNVINAYEYLQRVEKQKQDELARRNEELNRVYLTPHDVLAELKKNERPDLDALRDRLPTVR
jgi:hypothetical protein